VASPEEWTTHLFERLLAHPLGLSEHALLKELRGAGDLLEVADLELFQIHFLLFHQLYRLRESLERDGWGTLDIHCLAIRLRPGQGPDPSTTLPSRADPLAEYYLDLRNLEGMTPEQLRSLLDSFWTRFGAWTRQDSALATLGLAPGASDEEIRARFHALCLEHHPDRGGDADRFREVAAAMESLRR